MVHSAPGLQEQLQVASGLQLFTHALVTALVTSLALSAQLDEPV
jgi:hypothetical protein